MNGFTPSHCALSVCIAAVLLAGCSQTSSALPQSNAGAPSMRLEQLTPGLAQSPAGAGSDNAFSGAYYGAAKRLVSWLEFGFIPSGGRFNSNERILSPRDVHRLHKQWSYTTGSGVFSSPAVYKGVVYVDSEDGNVYALDAATGVKLWSYNTGTFDSSPAVVNGVVYVGSDDHNVYALNAATGAKLWSYPTGSDVHSDPAVANGVVYVGSDDNNVYALNAASGTKLWSYPTGDRVFSSPAVAKGVVYVGSLDDNVYALDAATGANLWSYHTGNSVISSPAVVSGVVYVGSGDGNVYALNAATGAKLWSYATGGGASSPAVANGVVFIGSDDGNVYALNAATGTKLWSHYPHTTGLGVHSSPAVANGVVYVGSGHGCGHLCGEADMYALKAATGAELWHHSAWRCVFGCSVDTSPAVANGVIYLGYENGNVYAFGL